jgi:hypothetical protein
LQSCFVFRSASLKPDFGLPDAFWDPELELLQLEPCELGDETYKAGAFCVITEGLFIAIVIGLKSDTHSGREKRPWCEIIAYNQVDQVKEAVESYSPTGRETNHAYMKITDIGWVSAQVRASTFRGIQDLEVELKKL